MSKPPIHFAKPYLLLCILIMLVALVYRYYRFSDPIIIYVDKVNITTDQKLNKPKSVLKLFPFDPNTIDSLSFDSLDLPRWVKSNVLKYRHSGGVFRTKSDFRKLYGVTDSLYSVIEPFITILPVAEINRFPKKVFKANKRKTESKRPAPVDINSAQAIELTIPRLVGEKRCVAIINFRERLGGFYSVSQLAEVYSIGDSLLPYIEEFYFVDTSTIVKRNFSDETWKSLVSHPYIDSYLAKHILQARKISPDITTIAQMLEAKVVDSATYSHLIHYFN